MGRLERVHHGPGAARLLQGLDIERVRGERLSFSADGQGGVAGGVVGGVVGGLPETPAAVRVGGNIKEPKKLKHVQPNYPAIARQARVQGTVILECQISPQGRVTEARVTDAMRGLARGRTTILIAHRLQTARTADRVAVLHAGRLAELGTHDELLALGGRYAAMWSAYESATR